MDGGFERNGLGDASDAKFCEIAALFVCMEMARRLLVEGRVGGSIVTEMSSYVCWFGSRSWLYILFPPLSLW